MAQVELTSTMLTVHVTGLNVVWSLKSRLEIPLAHVKGSRVDHEIARTWWKGWRVPGTNIPGVISAGTFYKDGTRVFWDVHDPDRTVVIDLSDESYAALVIQVDDPEAVAATINRAVEQAQA